MTTGPAIQSAESYADGGEKKLEGIFRSPVFHEDSTWRNYQDDWAVYYHLSPLRKNIFDWIHWPDRKLKVLELGAGCGALTSHFNALSNVSGITAIEGAPARAGLISLRCAKLPKVRVECQNIEDYQTDEKYDLVLLIGVLEYSGKYMHGPDPFQKNLDRARSFLAPGGSLVLAIENRLGHKYLAGMSEDHYGRPFEGISDYPNYKGVRTFDKATLQRMLTQAGLPTQYWFYPFPDYKIPNVVLSDGAFQHASFDWLSLLELPTMAGGDAEKTRFNEKQFLKAVSKNADPSVFMNSFLVFASQGESFHPGAGMLAVKMNALRSEKSKTKTYFLANGKDIRVLKKTRNLATPVETPYLSGYKNLGIEIVDALYLNEAARARTLLEKWREILLERSTAGEGKKFKELAAKHISGEIYSKSGRWLVSSDLDLIPMNMLYDENSFAWKAIDLEWDFFGAPVPLDLVMDRGLHDLSVRLVRFGGRATLGEMKLADPASFQAFEKWFQKEALGEDLNSPGRADAAKGFLRSVLKMASRSGWVRKAAACIMEQT